MKTLVKIVSLGLAAAFCTQWTWAATFTVTNTNDEGPGSFRQAIENANASPGQDMIEFAIGSGHRLIQPVQPLPFIEDAVTIDGTTQPGYAGVPLIEVDGSFLAFEPDAQPHLLVISSASGTVIRGLIVNQSPQDGVLVRGSHNIVIESNYIGTDRHGTAGRANAQAGINLIDSDDCGIGGITANSGNVISGNYWDGIRLMNSHRATVQGNFVGIDASGATRLANGMDGLKIIHSSGNVIGGVEEGARNVISGNGNDGIFIGNLGSSNNIVAGNFIGVDISGSSPLGNDRAGVLISRTQLYGLDSASNNHIGGIDSGAGNVISGNGMGGVRIVESMAKGNVIQGNLIGTGATGTQAIGNGGASGVFIRNAPYNQVGGTETGAGNVISGNESGVTLSDSEARGNLVQGNWIGTQIDGLTALANSGPGIVVTNEASANWIGGLDPKAANVIAQNGGAGVFVWSGNGNYIVLNSIFGNSGLGIDLYPVGVTPNDPLDSDFGANRLQNFPVLTDVTSAGEHLLVQGFLESAPARGYRMDFYGNSAPDPSGHGQGRTFLGGTTVEADASGRADFAVALPLVESATVVSATATDFAGNTSEFALSRVVDGVSSDALLVVERSGTGRGSVRSEPPGIECPAVCAALFPGGTAVTLIASPEEGSVFVGWDGDGEGDTERMVTLSGPRTVVAIFDALVENSADLGVSFSLDPDMIAPEVPFALSITVTNRGPAEARGVVLWSRVPAGVELLSITTSQGTFVVGDGIWEAAFGRLPAGASVEAVVSARAASSGVYTMEASLSSDVLDPHLADNLASIQIEILAPAFLAQALDAPQLRWITGGAAQWFGQTDITYDGIDAAQSGAIGYDEESWLETTVTGPGTLSFWWKVSSHEESGQLWFQRLGAGTSIWISGETDWHQVGEDIPVGTHTLRWYYWKDEIDSDGHDAGWLDQVSFVSAEPAAPAILVQPDSLERYAGGSATFSVVASGSTPLDYQWFKEGVALTHATESSLILMNLTSADAGGYTVVVTNPLGSVTSQEVVLTILPALSLDEVLDAPGLAWTTGGLVGWFGQTLVTHDGVDAAQSGAIGDLEESWLETTLTGPGTLRFWWKVSSEADYDFLELYLGSELQSEPISGEVDWTQVVLEIPEGDHTVSWLYSKDYIESSGADAGWVDQVEFITTSPVPPTILVQPEDSVIFVGGSASITVVASGTQPLTYQWYRGVTGDISDPIDGAAEDVYVSEALSSTMSVWVRVSNETGSVDSRAATITVLPPDPETEADLAVELAANPMQVTVGDRVVVTVTVRNGGPMEVGDATVVIEYPVTTEILDVEISQGIWSQTATAVVFDVGPITPNESAMMTVEMSPARLGPWGLAATIQSAAVDPDPTNNSASLEVTVLPPPMTISAPTSSGGQESTLTLTVPVVAGYDSVVEFTYELSPQSNWTPLPDAPHNSGSVTVPVEGRARFYRIVYVER